MLIAIVSEQDPLTSNYCFWLVNIDVLLLNSLGCYLFSPCIITFLLVVLNLITLCSIYICMRVWCVFGCSCYHLQIFRFHVSIILKCFLENSFIVYSVLKWEIYATVFLMLICCVERLFMLAGIIKDLIYEEDFNTNMMQIYFNNSLEVYKIWNFYI